MNAPTCLGQSIVAYGVGAAVFGPDNVAGLLEWLSVNLGDADRWLIQRNSEGQLEVQRVLDSGGLRVVGSQQTYSYQEEAGGSVVINAVPTMVKASTPTPGESDPASRCCDWQCRTG